MFTLAQLDLSGQAADFANNALSNARAIHEAINGLWDTVGQGGTYTGLCRVAVNAAVIALVAWTYNWYKSTLEDGFSWEKITHFIWPLVVISLLITSPGNPTGERLWSMTVGIRNFIDSANEVVLTSVSNTANLADSRRQAAMATALEAQVQSVFTSCGSTPDLEQRSQCMDQHRQTIQEWINQAEDNPWTQQLQEAWNTAYTLMTATTAPNVIQLANLYQNAFTSVLKGIVLAMGVAFSYLLEIALLLTAMLGPIAVGASLLPIPTKPIWAWITAMLSIGIAQLSFNIITGLMADVMINNPPSDAMAFIIFTGLLSPILALALASGGGIAVFSGLAAGAGAAMGGLSSLNSSLHQKRLASRSARIQQTQHNQLLRAIRR